MELELWLGEVTLPSYPQYSQILNMDKRQIIAPKDGALMIKYSTQKWAFG